MSELRDLLAKSKVHMGLRVDCLVDSNSLTPWGPLSKQNQTVLFYFNNFAQFCKRLGKVPARVGVGIAKLLKNWLPKRNLSP